MFEITVKGDTLEELHSRLEELSFSLAAGEDRRPAPALKPVAKRGKAPAKTEEPEPEDAALKAELNEPAPPAPATASQVVDAGTGKPIPTDAPVQMTFADVKTAAARLAAKDTPKLAEILGKYSAQKLSDVPKEQLGDFAADVMEALG